MENRWIRHLSLVVLLAVPAPGAPAQTAASGQQYGYASKSPILGAACPWCPWGALADEVKEAMKPYGYNIQICYDCSGLESVRIVDERRKPLPLPPQQAGLMSEPPDGSVDFGIVNLDFFVDGYRGTGIYQKDGPRKDLRLIAKIEDPEYYMVAARRGSFITDLSQIREKKLPVRILTDNSIRAQMILNYYGITPQALKSWGGAILSTEPANRGQFDVIISFVNSLNNTPESNVWYELSQRDSLRYLQLPDDLLESVAKATEWEIGYTPSHLLSGMDQPVKTIRSSGTVIYGKSDMPDQFAYDVAKAMDQQKHVLVYSILPFSYDSEEVWKARGVPLHPGAERYYKEMGYMH
jgi:uncharacterized protein